MSNSVTEASANPILWRIVATKCVCKATGEVIAYSNDCATGSSSYCIDQSCPTTCDGGGIQ